MNLFICGKQIHIIRRATYDIKISQIFFFVFNGLLTASVNAICHAFSPRGQGKDESVKLTAPLT